MLNANAQIPNASSTLSFSSSNVGGNRVKNFSALMDLVVSLNTQINDMYANMQAKLSTFEERTVQVLDGLAREQYATNLDIKQMVWDKIHEQKEQADFDSKPFLERVAISGLQAEKRRLQLMAEVDETLDLLRKNLIISSNLKEQVLTVKYKNIEKIEGQSETVTYPQQLLVEELKSYTQELEKVLAATPHIQESIKKEAKPLTQYFTLLPSAQQIYRDKITEKGNEIVLSSHRLALERNLLIHTLSLLPQMKNLSNLISQSKTAISAQKDNYQDGAAKGYTDDKWVGVEKYLNEQTAIFKEYTSEALAQEKKLNELRQLLVPIESDDNALKAFSAHNNLLEEQNKKSWHEMLAKINEERNAVRTTLINQWKVLYVDLKEFATQIAHIADAVSRKAFITKSRLTWATSAIDTFAKIEIEDPSKMT